MTKVQVRFQRANILVGDIEKSLTFYRDVLGFDVVFIKDSELDSYSYDVFDISRDAPVRFAVLKTDEQPNVLAMTEVKGLKPAVQSPRRSCIVLNVDDIDKVTETSKALGLKVYHEDFLVTKDGREGREFGIIDFDGNLVVVYTITKAAS